MANLSVTVDIDNAKDSVNYEQLVREISEVIRNLTGGAVNARVAHKDPPVPTIELHKKKLESI